MLRDIYRQQEKLTALIEVQFSMLTCSYAARREKDGSAQKEGDQLNDMHTTIFIPRRIATYTLK